MLKTDIDNYLLKQNICIRRAFEILADGDSTITPQEWAEFFVEYCDPAIGGVSVADASDHEYNIFRANLIMHIFHGIDMDSTDGINYQDFKTIITVFIDRHTYIPSRRPPTIRGSRFATFMDRFYTQGISIGGFALHWDRFMDGVIAVATVFTFMAAVWFCKLRNRPMIHNFLFWTLFGFSIFYAASLTTKISSLGVERFWNRRPIQHRFDFFNVYALLVVNLVYIMYARDVDMLSASSGLIENLERAIVLLSMARSCRLLVYITPLSNLFFVIARLLPTFSQIGFVLLVAYFVFAAVGRFLFGGMIYSTNPVLAGSAFAQSEFWGLNFNDYSSSLVTLFCLMIVNNWYVIAQGYILATGTMWTYVYFVIFFVVSNLVVLNILMALIIDAIKVLHEIQEETAQDAKPHSDLEQHTYSAYSAQHVLRRVLGAEEAYDGADNKEYEEVYLDEGEEDVVKRVQSQVEAGQRISRYGTFDASTPRFKASSPEDLDDDIYVPARAGSEDASSMYSGRGNRSNISLFRSSSPSRSGS